MPIAGAHPDQHHASSRRTAPPPSSTSPGATLTPGEVDALLAAVDDAAGRAARVAGRGGQPAARRAGRLLRAGRRTAAAARRPGRHRHLRARRWPRPSTPAGSRVVKPNLEELEEILGRDLVTVGDVVDAAREVLRARGTQDLLVSLGGHGALLITAEGSWWAGGPPLVPRSTVGAGDCTLSGLPARGRYARASGSRAAVAWGRAACLLPGTTVPGPERHRPAPRGPRRRRSRSPSQPVKDCRVMTDLITPDLVVLDLVATDKARRHPAARRPAAGGRPGHRPGRLPRRRRGPRGADGHRHARRHRPAARPVRARHRAEPRPSAGCRPASTSAPRTARPPWSS